MKTKILYFAALTAGLLIAFVMPAFAQAVIDSTGALPPLPDVTPETTIEELLNVHTAVYSAVILAASYLSKFIPGLNKIPGVALRVLTVAVVVALIFKGTGLANGWQLIIGYVGATLTYDKVTSPLLSTPKVEGVDDKKA